MYIIYIHISPIEIKASTIPQQKSSTKWGQKSSASLSIAQRFWTSQGQLDRFPVARPGPGPRRDRCRVRRRAWQEQVVPTMGCPKFL